jgi:uncharacterized membrane protein
LVRSESLWSPSMTTARGLANDFPIRSADRARPAAVVRTRIHSIDLLRGLVMVVMALDHTRDFFGASGANPRDVTDSALFLTRWITHFCAPTFVLLAGASAYLYGARGRSTGELSRFLLIRGLWLILIELTVVRFGWRFNFTLDFFAFQVIWVLGASMVVLAALVYLPRWAIASVGLAMIAGHNLLDGIPAQALGSAAWIWNFVHQPALVRTQSGGLFPLYSLVPWIGVMAAGYALVPAMRLEEETRRRVLIRLGAATTIGFVVLRATNLYGDPAIWTVQNTWLATVLSFINCEKYPPSLLYLSMTLGPALMLLALFDGMRGRLADWMVTFGRVPFLYYVVHIYLIHLLAVLYASAAHGDASFLLMGFPMQKPSGYGLSLIGLYLVWAVVVVTLYPLCRWFAALKQRRSEWWWSYL